MKGNFRAQTGRTVLWISKDSPKDVFSTVLIGQILECGSAKDFVYSAPVLKEENEIVVFELRIRPTVDPSYG
ncbi:MAG: hypothetical protein ACLRSW_10195 [Christensenellaceae bacterium]